MTPSDTEDVILARLLAGEGGAGPPRTAIPRRPPGPDAPLSFAQRRLWFLDRLLPGGAAYTIATAFRLRGQLEVGRLEGALRAVVARHEALRTVFFADPSGEPRQRVLPPGPERCAFAAADLSAEPDPAAAAAAAAAEEAARPFDLETGPLMRVRVLRLGPADHAVVCALHHLVTDGWSNDVLISEIGAHYAAAGAPAPLPIQYADYAAWQRSPEALAAAEASIAWWRERLRGLPALELPADFPRPAVQGFAGGRMAVDLGPEVRAGLSALARREGATLFTVVLAGFQAALAAWSGQRDFAVGAPVAGRTRGEFEPLIGFFVNTLVLRAELAGDPTFAELVGRTRAVVQAALARQDAPFDRLVEELRPERRLGETPLVQAVLAFAEAPRGGLVLPGLELEPLALEGVIAKFDLTLGLTDSPGGLRGSLDYRADLFAPETAAQVARLLHRVLAGAAAAPGARLSALVAPDRAEAAVLARLGRGPGAAHPPRRSLPELVAERARRAPAAVAIREGGRTETYGALVAGARVLARRLRAAGVGPEGIVGVCLPRSAALARAQLAAWLAGGAFLPLDPAHPPERLRAMLADAGARAVVTDAARRGLFAGGPAAVLDADEAEPGGEEMDSEPEPSRLAYVVATSGSTGRPKGVAVSHGALAQLAAWHEEAFAVTAFDVATLLAGPAFDASIWELWPALAAGAAVAVAPAEAAADPAALRDWLVAEGATLSFAPTPLAELLLGLPWPRTARLRWLLTGGDRLRTAPPAGLPFRLSNNYGPTEHAVVATSGPIEAGAAPRLPDIGRPIAGSVLRLLDPDLRPVPLGAVGEICLSGPSLARGYLGRPELTAASFVPDPQAEAPGARLYRTGDLGRWRPDGTLEFRGRADRQVKIRGVRVELGEVEAALLAAPGIRAAAAGIRAIGGESVLTAWLVAADGASADEDAVRAALRARLPAAMIPARWVWLERLPLTPNGKVDHGALPEPADAPAGEAPATLFEAAIAEIWRDALGRGDVDVSRSFFDLGGHSLLLVRVQVRLQALLGRPVPMLDLFAYPTVRALAARLGGSQDGGAADAALAASARRGAAQREARRRRRDARAGEGGPR